MCESETFGGSEKFLDEVHRKGHEVRKKMVYERKKERKKERSAREILESASRLDSWYNYERVESIR
jgi:hypothetical protein